MNIIVIGATGFIGKVLIPKLLQDGHQVTAWVRDPKKASGLPCLIEIVDFSDPQKMALKLTKKAVVINLAGEPIAQTKWTPEFKERFLNSRTLVTRNLVSALKLVPEGMRPKLLVNASAIGFYGNRGDEILDEQSSYGEGYLAEVCRKWEAEAEVARSIGVRTAILRIGIVLGRSGGMLSKLLPVRLGSGKQWISWIHVDDIVGMILHSIRNESVSGVFNAVAPEPVTQDQMNRVFSKQYHLPYFPIFAVPTTALKILTGELANVVLSSQRCTPKKMTELGYAFQYSNLKDAAENLIDGCEELISWQVVSRPRRDVFSFFSEAKNLEVLTPPWLNFKILEVKHIQGAMATGTLIDYSLKIHGLPVRWRTLIDEWILDRKFVDTQIRGPYQYWHHTHEFFDLEGNQTLILDKVRYRLPMGKLGRLAAGRLVSSDIRKIFNFRTQKIAELFKDSKESGV